MKEGALHNEMTCQPAMGTLTLWMLGVIQHGEGQLWPQEKSLYGRTEIMTEGVEEKGHIAR